MQSATLLDRLLAGKEASAYVVVEDTLEQSSVPILRAFIQRAQQRGQHVICLQADTMSQTFTGLASKVQSDGIAVVSVDTSDFGDSEEAAADGRSNSAPARIVAAVDDALVQRKYKSPMFVLDSITELLLFHSQPAVFSMLARVARTIEGAGGRLIVGAHADLPLDVQTDTSLFMPPYLASVAREATTRLRVANRQRTEARDVMGAAFLEERTARFAPEDNSPAEALCAVQHRRKTGKVTTETVHIVYSAHGEIESTAVYKARSGLVVDSAPMPTAEPDPAANLSFNLTLTDEQRAARDEVVLPYLKAQEGSGASGTSATGGGSIYYTPDSDDDFDEEDPDDDLDI
ncbi:Elongator complex protein 5 [Thamnocephalis sphaerospora]|uniref:Elongator complex protein 5 n=1 Tax=Thamnocephalis sphaerospora TaxID=78915 RepID=A0A4P9XRL4_9FUNG|nr:Elongator complex protein 5 [Thamnocephalis sphaerospora]|eukprot:RKP08708.1 Elongator complex protein 5 [Thamnocephalis sphaerospora]